MELTRESFEPFLSADSNKELIDNGKYGVFELIGNDFVEKQITEDDFYLYIHLGQSNEELDKTRDFWPFVVLK